LISHRSDIDGLRALAILPVLLFHAGVPGFSGGFVGVDVFFVISGFLITSIIRDEMLCSRFTLAGFYERRARRILPAFFAMMMLCLVLAAWTLYPHQFLSFSRSVIGASLFVSSFVFRAEAGYFDLESEQKPLLHTWSLSVEEIFYIFFPLLLLFLQRYRVRTQVLLLGAIALLSLVASGVALDQDPRSKAAFFLPHFRAWELLLGAMLAFALNANARRPLRDLLSLSGIAMIAFAVFGYSHETVFPGVAALLPCLGAACILYAGQQGSSAGGRLLSTPILVFFGSISYSLYLWHWPLLVFAHARFGSSLSGWSIASILVFSCVLATLSTRFVEQPLRRRDRFLSQRQVFVISAIGLSALVAVGLAGVMSQGWSGRYPPEVAHILFAEQDRDPRWRECLHTNPDAAGCLYGDRSRPPTLALWGDSHAAVYAVMLGELAAKREQSIVTFTMPSCPPLDGWALPDQSWHDNCIAFQRRAMQRILASPSIHSVLLAARFKGYPIDRPDSGFGIGLRATIARLLSAGKRVFIIYPAPELGEHVPLAMSRALLAGQPLTDRTQPIAEFLHDFGREFAFLDALRATGTVAAIKPHQQLCDHQRCFFYRDATVLYYDEHHLSLSGTRQLKALFEPILDIDMQAK
jgi:peptidoglycan/LPS O-acetylase OafA/YrhL